VSADHSVPQFVDLQVHTTASDGALSPTRVLETARDIGLSAVAITDHDTVAGLGEATAAGARFGVRVVPGVELSTHFGDDELHLLGLHLVQPERIASSLAKFQQERVLRADRMVEKLHALGMPLTMDTVLAQAQGGAVGRPHIARALVAGGWVRDFREAFDKYIGWGKPAYEEKARFDVADGIALVHDAGGLAVWAHPGEDATETRIAHLAEQGLDAVEVLHPSHTQTLTDRLVARVEAAGLLPSGGSDWHGSFEGPRRLGGQLVPKVWLDWQDARVAARRDA
jgi:hypothetical protein